MPALACLPSRRRAIVPVALVACFVLASPTSAAVVFDAGPGAGPPPDTLGPYAVNPYPGDARPNGIVHNAPAAAGSLGFSRAMSLRRIADATWSSGAWGGGTFSGAVYWNLGAGATTITLPEPQRAFYLYGQPDYFGTYAMIATAQDGTTSGEIYATTGPDGPNARFFGFYGTGEDRISSVTITSPEADDDFAVGSFGGGDVADGPAVAQISGDASVAEGTTASYAVDATDPRGWPLTYEWSVTSGPGSISGPADGASADVRVADGPASVGLQVVVADVDGRQATRRLVVHARNVAPEARLAARNDRQVGEGQSRIYAYAIDDPGEDAIDEVRASCGHGGQIVEDSEAHSAIGGSFACRFGDGPADPAVTVSVTDSDGEQSARDAQTVTVEDVAPVLTFAASDARVDEGSTRLYPYTIDDPGDDAQTVVADCGAGGEKVPGSERNTATTGSFECAFPDGMAHVTVHAVPADSDDAVGDDDAQAIAIDNVAPAVTIAGGAERSVEAGAVPQVVDYAIVDPGRDTVAAVETSCGADGAKVAGSDRHTDTAGSFSCAFPHAETSSAVSVRATDSDGDSGGADTQEVTVGGGALTVRLSGSNRTSVDESASERSFAYSIGVPAHESITAVDTSCGERGTKVPGSDARSGRSGRFRCVFVAGPASSVVSVTASDGAHHASSDRQPVAVLDPPVRAGGRRISGVEHVEIANRKVARFHDPTPYSAAGEYDATIDWGDGSARTTGTIAKSGDGAFSVRGTHTYARFDTRGYTVGVTIGDVDNPANTAVATSRAAIADAAIHVREADVTTLPAFGGTVATFRDEGDGPVSDFSASIAWGDGARGAGTVSRASDGTFVVAGAHAYARSGRYDASVRVDSVGGSDDRAWTDVLVYAFATGAGATFTIGDARATPGAAVTFQGSSWSRQNPLASRAAVDATFKGFVAAQPGRAVPRCGDGWTTSASAALPAELPAFMGVVATGSLVRSGSMFGGDVRKVVVVKTDGGYRPDPARAGTGKVVAVVCG